MATSFAVNWDYRCPFARNAHEHVVAGLGAGADWDVTFVAFSLGQVHVPEGGTAVWDDPDHAASLLSMEAGIAVRDEQPDHFLAVHDALFRARHDDGKDLRELDVVRSVVDKAGADEAVVADALTSGRSRAAIRAEHEDWVSRYRAFGVPTFVKDDAAVFVRLMTRPGGDGKLARTTIDGVVDLLGRSELNEFKHTTTAR